MHANVCCTCNHVCDMLGYYVHVVSSEESIIQISSLMHQSVHPEQECLIQINVVYHV